MNSSIDDNWLIIVSRKCRRLFHLSKSLRWTFLIALKKFLYFTQLFLEKERDPCVCLFKCCIIIPSSTINHHCVHVGTETGPESFARLSLSVHANLSPRAEFIHLFFYFAYKHPFVCISVRAQTDCFNWDTQIYRKRVKGEFFLIVVTMGNFFFLFLDRDKKISPPKFSYDNLNKQLNNWGIFSTTHFRIIIFLNGTNGNL